MTARLALDIRLRAERKLGEMLRETVHRGGPNSRGVSLPDGISYNASSKWQRIADLPEEVFVEGAE